MRCLFYFLCCLKIFSTGIFPTGFYFSFPNSKIPSVVLRRNDNVSVEQLCKNTNLQNRMKIILYRETEG